jgi:hypothetical protein
MRVDIEQPEPVPYEVKITLSREEYDVFTNLIGAGQALVGHTGFQPDMKRAAAAMGENLWQKLRGKRWGV